MTDVIFLILLVLHIGFIIPWVGGAFLFSLIIAPSLQKLSAAARTEFIIMTFPGFLRFILVNAVGAVTAGVILFGYVTRVSTSFAPSPSGLPFVEGGAAAGFVAFVLALGVVYPTGSKLVKLFERPAESDAPASAPSVQTMGEAARLSKRMRIGALSASGILVLALILMVIGANI